MIYDRDAARRPAEAEGKEEEQKKKGVVCAPLRSGSRAGAQECESVKGTS